MIDQSVSYGKLTPQQMKKTHQKSLQTNFDTADEALDSLPKWISGSDENLVVTVDRYAINWVAVGKEVRNKRLATGMSLRCAARWMSISAAYLSELERGTMPWSASRLNDMENVIDMASRMPKKSSKITQTNKTND